MTVTTEIAPRKTRIQELTGDELGRWKSWLEGLHRPAEIRTPHFEVDFNLEYWSCRLFGGDSAQPKKVHEIRSEAGQVLGRIEVGAYAGMNLEPFDRLTMLALIQLWYDQGADPQGRIAFSYRELFRRLGVKAGGRQNTQIKDALDRLRRCFITLTNCFMTRDEGGRVVPVEAEADPFTILRLKQTATVGTGEEAQHLVVCQLSPVVLSGLVEPGRLRPRIHSGVIQKLRAKNSTAILLHGFYNGRLRIGEGRFFEYSVLGHELGMVEQFHSNLVNRLLAPHEKLEEIGAVAIGEQGKGRRGKGLTVTLLAPVEEVAPTTSIVVEASDTKRVPVDKKDKDQLPLFEETPTEYDEQLLLAFRAAGVKQITQLLKRYGKNMSERALWALLENVREKNADENWEWRRGPDAYVAKCLNDGFYISDDYRSPKDRLQEQQGEEAKRAAAEEVQRTQEEALQRRREARLAGLDEAARRTLEDAVVVRLQARSQGFRNLLKRNLGALATAPLEERYGGLSNTLIREAFDQTFNELLQEPAA